MGVADVGGPQKGWSGEKTVKEGLIMTIPKQGPVIAIDGPAGTGKSSATRRLADALGFVHVDTGAFYPFRGCSLCRDCPFSSLRISAFSRKKSSQSNFGEWS